MIHPRSVQRAHSIEYDRGQPCVWCGKDEDGGLDCSIDLTPRRGRQENVRLPGSWLPDVGGHNQIPAASGGGGDSGLLSPCESTATSPPVSGCDAPLVAPDAATAASAGRPPGPRNN